MQLKYQNTTVPVTALHFYGCSFTAGHELLDEEYAQRIEDPDPDNTEDFVRLCNERNELVEEKERRQRRLSWAGQLSRSLGLDYYNNAEAGNSLDNMRSKFYNDVINGKIESDHAVFIGATGYFRETRFHPLTVDVEGVKNDAKSLGRSFGRVITQWADAEGDRTFARKYIDYKPPYVFLYEYMNALRDIIWIAEKYNIRLYLVTCLEPISSQYFLDVYVTGHELMSAEYEYMDSLRFMEKEINKYIITDTHMEAFVSASAFTKERHPGGHPKLHAHIKWAKYIEGKING